MFFEVRKVPYNWFRWRSVVRYFAIFSIIICGHYL
nr:MAG TPA: hypothetical protein [Caudoviricetes sp.]